MSVLDELEAWSPPTSKSVTKRSVLDELEAWKPSEDTAGKKASRFVVAGLSNLVETGMNIKKLAVKALPLEKQKHAEEKIEQEREALHKRKKELGKEIGKPDVFSGTGEFAAQLALFTPISRIVGGAKALATSGKVFAEGKPAAEIILNLMKRGTRGVLTGEAIGTLETGSPVKALKTAGTFGAIEIAVPFLGMAGKKVLVKPIGKIAEKLKRPIAEKAVETVVLKPVQSLTEIEQNIAKVRAKIKKAKPLRKLQEEVKHKWRQEQTEALANIPTELTGKARYIEQLRVLKKFGKMPKVNFEPLDISVSEQDSLFNAINESSKITFWNRLPAQKGLMKIFGQYGGEVPTENELSLLGDVFGRDFVKDLLTKRDTYAKMAEIGYQIGSLPRAMMASFDMSAPLRQGAFLAARHPKEFVKAFFNMHRFFFSEKAYENSMNTIAKRPTYELMQKARLPLTKVGGMLTQNEEVYMSNWGEYIPWTRIPTPLKMSNRAFVGFLNKLRADVFDKLVLSAEKMGRNPTEDEELLTALGKFIGAGSGRGPLTIGKYSFENSAKALNTILFSPRLLASRLYLMNPKLYTTSDPFVRKEVLKTLLAYIAARGTILGVANMAGAEVVTNLSSTDALKIKVGNTRTDISGGFQQYLILAFREVANKTTSSTTGKTRTLGEGYKPTTRFDLLLRAAQYKEAPIASFITQWAMQQSEAGEPFQAKQEVAKRFTPMILADIKDIFEDDPDLAKLLLEGTAGFYGAGIQTY